MTTVIELGLTGILGTGTLNWGMPEVAVLSSRAPQSVAHADVTGETVNVFKHEYLLQGCVRYFYGMKNTFFIVDTGEYGMLFTIPLFEKLPDPLFIYPVPSALRLYLDRTSVIISMQKALAGSWGKSVLHVAAYVSADFANLLLQAFPADDSTTVVSRLHRRHQHGYPVERGLCSGHR
jgi:hypothetical protein